MAHSKPFGFICSSCRDQLKQSLRKRIHLRRDYTRPSFAPKPVLDIKHIARNPGLYAQNCIDRNYGAVRDNPWEIYDLVKRRAEVQESVLSLRQRNNVVQHEIKTCQFEDKRDNKKHYHNEKLQVLLAEAKSLKDDMRNADVEEKQIESQLLDLAIALPNLSSPATPEGREPETLKVRVEDKDHPNYKPRSHAELGVDLDLLDFTSASNTSGWGWYFLKNEGAFLEQALIQYALSELHKRRWKIVSPPSIVYSHVAAACGFQPRDQHGEQQIYTLQQPETDASKPSLSLTGTAEIPLAAMNAGATFSETDLPLKVAAVSRCYRAEAGARGVDTKGLYRVHEFSKVEMFAWTLPNEEEMGDKDLRPAGNSASEQVFKEMVEIQEYILSSLGLPFRILEMPALDLGASASRKQDIEAFFPSRRIHDGGWGEVTSASICTDYQSRRLFTRVKAADGNLYWPHTVNGTALAVPRIIAAIIENGWSEAKGSIKIPDVLRPWMPESMANSMEIMSEERRLSYESPAAASAAV